MMKWSVVTGIVLLAFTLIILGFGFLLHDNEKKHIAYNQQLKQDKNQQTKKINAVVVEAIPSISIQPQSTLKNSVNLGIIANNLTCVSDEQCVMVNAQFADLSCDLAVNVIGAAQLKKAKKDNTLIKSCKKYPHNASVTCLENLCSISH
ncbi:hypothetical protein AADZ91_06510 [Colwelliaceae bacterium 6441]